MKSVIIPLTELFKCDSSAEPVPKPSIETVSDDEVGSQDDDKVATQHRVSSKTKKPVIQIHASKTLPKTSHIQNSTGKRALQAAEAAAEAAAAAVAEKVGEQWVTIKNCDTTVSRIGGRAGARPTKETKEREIARARGAGKFE